MFTLVSLTLIVIQKVFGYTESLLMEESDGFEHMARRPSEALLLTNGEVPSPGPPKGPDVRGRLQRGSCEQGSRDWRASWGKSLCVGWSSFVLALGAFPNGCWRGAPLLPGIPGSAFTPWTPASAVPQGCAMQYTVTEGKNKVNWECQLVFPFAAELSGPLEMQVAACADFIWVTTD